MNIKTQLHTIFLMKTGQNLKRLEKQNMISGLLLLMRMVQSNCPDPVLSVVIRGKSLKIN